MFKMQSSSWDTDCEDNEEVEIPCGSYTEEVFGGSSPDCDSGDFLYNNRIAASFPLPYMGNSSAPLEIVADPMSPFYFSPLGVKEEYNPMVNAPFFLNSNGQIQALSFKDESVSSQPPPPQAAFGANGGIDILIDGQPASEVRTRTPSEIRTFSVSARVLGPYRHLGAANCRVSLMYAHGDHTTPEHVAKEILGGTKLVPILTDGTVVFDSLSISESSTKHKEREFMLEFTVLRVDGETLVRRNSKPFYAYSHKKVLQRRGSVKLRALNKNSGRVTGGDSMHVIGTPFIQGPALSLVFRTHYGDVVVKPTEYFSDSVLFFELPAFPIPMNVLHSLPYETEFKVQVLVTNDGRTHSNPVDFTYYIDGSNDGAVRSRSRY